MHSETRFLEKILISVVAVVVCASPAFGAACTTNPCTGFSTTGQDTTDRTAFETTNNDLNFSNITFDGVTGTYTTAGGLTTTTSDGLYSLTFIGCLSSQSSCASGNTKLVDGTVNNWNGGADNALTGPNTIGGANFDTITITLPAGVYAFGVDLLNANNWNPTAPFLVQADSGSQLSTATAVSLPGSVFYGYRSATPISQVTIYSGNPNLLLGLDNFEIGEQPPAVAEVSTLLMVGSGLFMLRFARRLIL